MSENKINDGGPAFPKPQSSGFRGDAQVGMSLRDYFIAHAPAEPQPWFEPVISKKPLLPSWFDEGLSTEQRDQVEEAIDYGAKFEDQRVMDFVSRLVESKKRLGEWEKERVKQRYVQWPAAWADAMLKARQKPRVEGV